MDDHCVLFENIPPKQNWLYKSIYLLITEEKAKKILLNNKHSIWIALADYPYEINPDLRATCIARIQEKSPKTVFEIQIALQCADKLKAPLLIAKIILNELLNNEFLTSEIEEQLGHSLFAFLSKNLSELSPIIRASYLKLKQELEEKARILDMDYFKLHDELRMHRGKANWLGALGVKNSFRGNKYDFTTWFINKQLERCDDSSSESRRHAYSSGLNYLQPQMDTVKKIERVKKCLENIEPELYEASEYHLMRQRIAIEYTLRCDNIFIITDVMLPLLNSVYLNWQRALLNIPNYINFIIANQNQPLLSEILNVLSEEEQVDFMRRKDENGLRLLDHFIQSTALIIILNQLPKKHLLSVVCEKNSSNKSLIDLSRTYLFEKESSLSIVAILECLSENDRLTALKEKIRTGVSLLPAYQENDLKLHMGIYFTYLNGILKLLPANARLEAVLQKDKDECSSINIIAKDSTNIDLNLFNAVKVMLKLLPTYHRILAINSTNHLGSTLLQQACRDPNILNKLLQLLPMKALPPAIFAKYDQGSSLWLDAIHAYSMKDTMQHHECNRSSPESLKVLLKFLLNKSFINDAAHILPESGYTIPSCTTNYHCILKIILNSLPKSERTSLLTKINPSGFTLLQEEYKSPVAIKNILELLDQDDLLSFILIKSKYNYNLLSYIIDSPENLKLVLSFLPIKDRLKAIQENCNDSISLLEYATKNYPGSIIALLEQLTYHDCYVAIQKTFSDGSTLLHHQNILQSHVYLNAILLKIHESNRLAAIQAKNSDGNAVVLLAAQHPKSIEVIFELLPLSERLEAKKTQNTSGYTLFNYAIDSDSFDSLETILKFFPKKDCFALLQEENYNGCTFLENLHGARSEFIPQLIAFLPENDRLKVEQSVESDEIEEECQFRP